MSKIEIVPYQDRHREVVRRCVYETGWGGRGVAPFFTDPELFADILTLYYTDYVSEHNFIGVVDGEPAGYLLGCPDTAAYNQAMKKQVFPRLLKNLFSGKYKVDRVTGRYLLRGVLQLVRGEVMEPPLEQYPAHLHIDLFKPFRRVGLGSRLMHHYMDYLRGRGVPGLHLATSTVHTTALPFYNKLGFRKYAVRRTTTSYFREAMDQDLYTVWYVKSLAQP